MGVALKDKHLVRSFSARRWFSTASLKGSGKQVPGCKKREKRNHMGRERGIAGDSILAELKRERSTLQFRGVKPNSCHKGKTGG